MRYVIIGGSGFVGQATVALLREKGEKIIVVDKQLSQQPVQFVHQYITEELTFSFLPDDVVVHLAANQYYHRVPRKNWQGFFESVDVGGTENVLKKMEADGAHRMVFFSTDMVYGKPQTLPVGTQHPQKPFGYYGKSKKAAEALCEHYRHKGMNITVFRPRMIIGKGRMGILMKLFKLIEYNLPVPMIGSGRNCYQMAAVQDCAAAIYQAVQHQLPNKAYNLSSENPPTVRDLLKQVVVSNYSKSLLILTWAWVVKRTLDIPGVTEVEIMYKEQYMIADENYLIDISETKHDLGRIPQCNDVDVMMEAFRECRRKQRAKPSRLDASRNSGTCKYETGNTHEK